jgi:hypothetical protein
LFVVEWELLDDARVDFYKLTSPTNTLVDLQHSWRKNHYTFKFILNNNMLIFLDQPLCVVAHDKISRSLAPEPDVPSLRSQSQFTSEQYRSMI